MLAAAIGWLNTLLAAAIRRLNTAGVKPYAAAAGAAVGAWLALPVPLFVVLLVLTVFLWQPNIVLAFVLFATLSSTFGAKALAGLSIPETGDIEGWVTLLDDPRSLGSGGVRVTVRYQGKRHEAQAHGSVVGHFTKALSGERLHISGVVRATSSDWQRWRHVVASISVKSVNDHAPAAPLASFTNRIRRLLERGAQSLSTDHRSLFTGMVYGDDREQSARLADDFRAAGLGHLLVVSGQNVAFVLALASPLTTRLRPGGRLLALLLVLGVFAMLTRFEPSVLRAVAMAGVAVTSAALGRPEVGRRTLAWAIAGVLVIDPFVLRMLAFQLSVCATAGILWITPPLTEVLRGPRVLRLAVATTAGAQLAVMPLLVAVFDTVPLASLPANVIAGPASGPVMMWGLTAGLVAGLVGGPLAWLVHQPTAGLLWWVSSCAAVAATAPPAVLGAVGAVLVIIGVFLTLGADRLQKVLKPASVDTNSGLRRSTGHSVGTARLGAASVDTNSDTDRLPGKDRLRSGDRLRGEDGLSDGDRLRGKNGLSGEDRLRGEDGLSGGGGLSGKEWLPGGDRLRGKNGLSGEDRLSGEDGLRGGDGLSGKGVVATARLLGVGIVAAVLAYSLVTANVPPSGWSTVPGASLFNHRDELIVVLNQPGPPRRLLESLRLAGVRQVDLIVASDGDGADAHAVLALVDRYGEDTPVVAPPLHRVPYARTVQAGEIINIGMLQAVVSTHTPRLELVMGVVGVGV